MNEIDIQTIITKIEDIKRQIDKVDDVSNNYMYQDVKIGISELKAELAVYQKVVDSAILAELQASNFETLQVYLHQFAPDFKKLKQEATEAYSEFLQQHARIKEIMEQDRSDLAVFSKLKDLSTNLYNEYIPEQYKSIPGFNDLSLPVKLLFLDNDILSYVSNKIIDKNENASENSLFRILTNPDKKLTDQELLKKFQLKEEVLSYLETVVHKENSAVPDFLHGMELEHADKYICYALSVKELASTNLFGSNNDDLKNLNIKHFNSSNWEKAFALKTLINGDTKIDSDVVALTINSHFLNNIHEALKNRYDRLESGFYRAEKNYKQKIAEYDQSEKDVLNALTSKEAAVNYLAQKLRVDSFNINDFCNLYLTQQLLNDNWNGKITAGEFNQIDALCNELSIIIENWHDKDAMLKEENSKRQSFAEKLKDPQFYEDFFKSLEEKEAEDKPSILEEYETVTQQINETYQRIPELDKKRAEAQRVYDRLTQEKVGLFGKKKHERNVGNATTELRRANDEFENAIKHKEELAENRRTLGSSIAYRFGLYLSEFQDIYNAVQIQSRIDPLKTMRNATVDEVKNVLINFGEKLSADTEKNKINIQTETAQYNDKYQQAFYEANKTEVDYLPFKRGSVVKKLIGYNSGGRETLETATAIFERTVQIRDALKFYMDQKASAAYIPEKLPSDTIEYLRTLEASKIVVAQVLVDSKLAENIETEGKRVR